MSWAGYLQPRQYITLPSSRLPIHCTALHCTALYFPALHCTALYTVDHVHQWWIHRTTLACTPTPGSLCSIRLTPAPGTRGWGRPVLALCWDCTLLCYTLLYWDCTLLCCTVLYSTETVLYSTETVLYFAETVLYSTETVLYSTVLYSTLLRL